MKCLRCSAELKAKTYEGVEIDQCPKCHGTWLDDKELGKIVQAQDSKFSPEIIHETMVRAFEGVPAEERRTLDPCLKCGKAMVAVNYQYGSGVIIDRCNDGHGIWLDAHELENAQIKHEHSTKEGKENREAWIQLAESIADANKSGADEKLKKDTRPTRYIVNSLIRKILGA